MRRVLWKEFREKRGWLLLFLVTTLVPVLLFHEPLCFSGKLISSSVWTAILLVPGILLGMTTFSREISYNCQDFLLSRPVGWGRVLGAKFIMDISIMLVSVLLGYASFRLSLLPEYSRFMGIHEAAVGMGIAFGAMLFGYLPGFGASAVLPGFWGSSLVMVGLAVAATIEGMSVWSSNGSTIRLITVIASWAVAAALSSVVVSRKWIGLPAPDRARRYVATVFGFSFLVQLWTIPLSNRIQSPEFFSLGRSSMSRSGEYVFTAVFGADGKAKLIRVADGKTADLPKDLPVPGDSVQEKWTEGDNLLLLPDDSKPQGGSFASVRMDAAGRIKTTEYPERVVLFDLRVSKNGRWAAISKRKSGSAKPGLRMTVVDTSRMSKITTMDLSREATTKWDKNGLLWVSDLRSGDKQRVYIGYSVSRNGLTAVAKRVKG